MSPLVALCHLGLGRLHGCAGQRRQSLDSLRAAITALRELDMPFWLEQARAELDG